MRPPRAPSVSTERARRLRIVGERARLARIADAADDDIGLDAGADQRFAPARGDDEELRGTRGAQHLGILRGEVRGVARRELVPRQWIGAARMERLADDDDRALALGRHHHDVAGVR